VNANQVVMGVTAILAALALVIRHLRPVRPGKDQADLTETSGIEEL